MILSVLAVGSDFAGYDNALIVVTLVTLGLVATVGCIKGTPGPNQYGPDPLANVSRKSAT